MASAGPTRWLTLLGIVLALALSAVLIACGGDSPDADGERAATPRTEATETGDAPTATKAPLLTSGRTSAKTDREALVALYNATDSGNWGNDANWLSDAPLGEWHGVTTNDEGRVTKLDLGNNGLIGEMPPELGSLSNLLRLSLSVNELIGEIPAELGSLSNLISLYLDYNLLREEIPAELGNLSNLEYLDLGSNDLSGEIPPELGNLSNLGWLSLSDNDLSGCVPSSLEDQLTSFSNLGGLPFC